MMSNLPLVSIAMCVYNGERFLEAQLDSILTQGYKNIEIVIVDDCSTDGSRQILAQYRKQHGNIKLHFNESNLGYVKNFEKAIYLCKGELIALSDQDDIWHSEKISRQTESIGDSLLIYHDSEYIDQDDRKLNIKMSDILNLYHGDSPLPFILKNCISGHSMMFKKALITQALPFDPKFFHDWSLSFVAASIGSIQFLPDCLVKYRQHLNNTIDIMNLRKDNINEPVVYNPLRTEREWIRKCSEFDSKYQSYIAKIDHLLNSSPSLLNKIKLLTHLNKHKGILLHIDKIREKDKFKMLKEMVWTSVR